MPKSMKQLNCESLRVEFNFDESEFNKDKFIEELEPEHQDDSFFVRSLGSKNSRTKEHAHFIARFDGEDSSMTIDFVRHAHPIEDLSEPYIEDVHIWLASFFEDKVIANVTGYFRFDKKYESEIQLFYPVLLKNPLMRGTEISGYEVAFPDEADIHSARISSNGSTLFLHLFVRLNVNLLDIGYKELLQTFGEYADALVKKKV